MADLNIQFFGSADRRNFEKDSQIVADYPAWYFTTKVEELRNEIELEEDRLRRGVYPADRIPEVKAVLDNKKTRYTDIAASMPRLKAAEKDTLAAIYKELGDKISETLFTRTEMKKGLADAHEEARRMSQPIIEIDNKIKQILPSLNVRTQGGKLSRNEATRAWKIIGKVLGESTNSESLRKDAKYGTYRPDIDLKDMVR